MGSPELLFLDEPTTGFDPRARREFWSMLQDLRDTGTTMVLTTHYMDEAQHLADRSAIMRRGEIVAEGSLDQLTAGLGGSLVRFDRPPSVAVADLAEAAGAPCRLDGDRVEMTVGDDAQAVLTRLLPWAASAGVALAGLEVVRPSLDDVFMELSGETDRPEADGSPAVGESVVAS